MSDEVSECFHWTKIMNNVFPFERENGAVSRRLGANASAVTVAEFGAIFGLCKW
jgi:hypothetical protein